MDENIKQSINFSLVDSLDELMRNINEVLPCLKTEWKLLEDEAKRPYFKTYIGRVSIEIHEFHSIFTLHYKNDKTETRRRDSIKKSGKASKKIRLKVYEILSKRFEEEIEHHFYRRVLRTLNGQLAVQQQRNEVTFTEALDNVKKSIEQLQKHSDDETVLSEKQDSSRNS